MKIDGWKIATAVIGALWVVTLILAQRVASHYDAQDTAHWTAIAGLREENRSLERKFFAVKSDVRSVSEKLDGILANSGYLVNLVKKGRGDEEETGP